MLSLGCSLQVPNVVSFNMDATLSMTHGASGDSLDTLSFPIFSAGHRRSRHNWVNSTDALPEGVRDTYTAAQTKLLCTAQVYRFPHQAPRQSHKILIWTR
jgi:hypothetical protein